MHSTLLATTAQRVRGLGFSGVAASPWKVPRPGFVAKPAPGCPRTSSSATWTSLSAATTLGAWRSWQMDFRCSVARSLRSTPRWCPPSEPTDFLATTPTLTMVLRWPRRAGESNAPTLSFGHHGRTRLVVLAAEVGGRWSEEARAFVSQLAKAKARSVPRVLVGRARQAWHHRWSSMLACASARAFALSLLDRRPGVGADGVTPSSAEVVAACRHLPSTLA